MGKSKIKSQSFEGFRAELLAERIIPASCPFSEGESISQMGIHFIWRRTDFFACYRIHKARLKFRGFRFEATHLNNPERIEKLIAMMASALA